ncbi:hypothetical protein Bca52824_018128 [Brassica carinata]|uniref:TF-B3 domain-containing protein n=1 Tax=Brassica carinata TaxID=52824 RepID=A0A8X7VPC3_BRACI|nr:hypothetical protein Bca52824_018128 [Brassica carinata]
MRMTTPQEPHFLKPLFPGFHSGVTIPLEFFSKHIQGSEKNKPWKLRSDASDQVWEVIREGRTLTKGWKEFATAHDLRIGDIVIFKHGRLAVVRFSIQILTALRKKPTDDAPSFSFDYRFLAEFLPVEAMRLSCFEPTMQRGKTCQQGRKSWTASRI